MNREIKFRAWDGEDMLTNLDSINLEMVRLGVIQTGDDVDDQQKVTFMQFTGLKDKNGVDVYEGDVVKWTDMVHNHGTGFTPVKYSEVFARFCGNSHPTNDGFRPSWGLEVIGNIYQNPELLNL